jgi:hypothetical protein
LYGHIHYGFTHVNEIEDYKAVSMNVTHSFMVVTDSFYTRLGNDEINSRIINLAKQTDQPQDNIAEEVIRYREFLLLLSRENKRRTA